MKSCNGAKGIIYSLFFAATVLFFPSALLAQAIIIDHTCIDLSKIPEDWLNKAKTLTLHYAHTSHGSQIISGIQNLESLYPKYSVAVNESDTEGLPYPENPPEIRIYDGNPSETYIEPDDYWDGTSGLERTRTVANTGHYQFSMWAWCGQISYMSDAYIQQYLTAMDQLETEFPSMRFIYMTGHLDGTGSTGDLHRRNEIIRTFCRNNNKVLFDFADIERYNPDGADFLDLGADDGCNYNEGNWAEQWCSANPGSDLCDACESGCAHSMDLNCNRKARAFWWMIARLVGWPGPAHTPRRPLINQTIQLLITDQQQ
jgi:hypothetical protein